MQTVVRYGAVFLSGTLVGALGLMIFFKAVQGTATPDVAVDLSHHHEVMAICVDHILTKLSPNQVNIGFYERVWRLCGNQIFNGLYLDDFLIRRQKFVHTDLDERVNLWLVVTITISGVILAALQLIMSYKLAADGRTEFGKDSQLALEAGKISLKSSITGVLILALSLAFFMIYVVYIYTIHEVPVERPRDLQTPAEPQDSQPPPNGGSAGSVGPAVPPSAPKAATKK